jgi:ferredoxin, 2Fe-2S
MIRVHLISPDGSETTVEGREGESLMQAAVAANVRGIEADCGGLLSCATCHVIVREPFAGQLPPPELPDRPGAGARRPDGRLARHTALRGPP